MSSILNFQSPQITPRFEWLPIAAGLLLLYVPPFYEFATTIWQDDAHAHGPLILAVVVWLIWDQRTVIFAEYLRVAPVAGLTLLVFGLLVYVLGYSQDVSILTIGSLAPVLAGVLLSMRGWQGIRRLWFPVFFVAFMVPLPGFFVDALTGPLKQSISEIAVKLLYAADYPIARSGVLLTIGQYELLVADACSGLHTMFSLSALGLLFMYMTARASLLHNAIMLGSILPIAFVANIIRVLVLILITYHFGDGAGQGFLHGFSGIVLFVISLLSLFILDAVLAKIIKPRKKSSEP